ncbi:MAG: HAMP domain-containing protein, partial [Candidatus Eremiobacteraeota bacterium]|nr:HAMP domain-containing protein [Candidatus Eremiobacteraeota bacterium]
MGIWSRLGLTTKIFLGLAAMLALMAAVIVVGLAFEGAQEHVSDTLIGQLLPARTVARNLKHLVVSADDQGAWYLLSTDRIDKQRFIRRYREDVREIDGWLHQEEDGAASRTERTALDGVMSKWSAYLGGNQRAFTLRDTGRVAPAQALYTKVSYTSVMGALDAYDGVLRTNIASMKARRAYLHRIRRIIVLSLGAAAFLLAILITLCLRQTLRRRLGGVSRAIDDVVHVDFARIGQSFRDIAEGDLQAPRYLSTREPIYDQGDDELGLLARSYNDLIAGLREMGQSIEQSILDAQRRHEAEERLTYLERYDETTGL